MGFFMHHLMLCMVLSIFVIAFTVANFVPSLQPSCLHHERSALLHFKQSFHTNCDPYSDSSPKMESWANADCCSWDGVKCHTSTGHVIGLNLSGSCIYGTFPPNSSLFSLTHLQDLDLSWNRFNLSRIPSEISVLPNLRSLKLRGSSFCCQIPSIISKLSKLKILDISHNSFLGSIPSSFSNLTMLTNLSLSDINETGNFMPGEYSSWLPKLHNLESLDHSGLNLPSEMPSLLVNLTNLKELDLRDTQLTGPLPQEFANLTQLQSLRLDYTNFEGVIPQWVSQLTKLQTLGLSYNNLFGNFDLFSNLKGLRYLDLSGIKLTFLPYSRTNTSLLKLYELRLQSCNLTEFPKFLRHQDEIRYLDLSRNNIKGTIPRWFSKVTKECLFHIDISYNQLTGFEQLVGTLPWINLRTLNIQFNEIHGQLPTLPTSLENCFFSQNFLTGFNSTSICNARSLGCLDLSFNNMSGEIPDCIGHQFARSLQILTLQNNNLSGVIPKFICHATSLIYMDLSSNNLNGQVPSCMGDQLENTLQFLILRNNSFLGTIPLTFTRHCKLHQINLSQNNLQGPLPRSLVNCTMLEVLDIGKNHVSDTFPSWLGSLPHLKVLVLGHNKFHGSIGSPISDLDFRSLHIMDLSHNQHIGNMPSQYIQILHGMKDSNEDTSESYNISIDYRVKLGRLIFIPLMAVNYSMTITNKRVDILYERILKAFKRLDFSSNNFTGRIPIIIGDLKGLKELNLSNNNLHGEIPSSLVNLINLESLDLSQNKLSGQIPQQLSQITFLEVFNVSYNDLVGRLPQGKQFDSFDNTSYEGNPKLCGFPLSKKCKDVDSSPPLSPVPSDEGSNVSEFIDWVIRSLGCLSGCIVGFIMGKLYITDKYHEWFVDTFGR